MEREEFFMWKSGKQEVVRWSFPDFLSSTFSSASNFSADDFVAVFGAAAGEVVIPDRLQDFEHAGHQLEVDRRLDVGDVLADVLRARGADERRGDAGMRRA